MKNIKAVRDGETREFSPYGWSKLPPDKCGWKEVKAAPAKKPAPLKDEEPKKPAAKKRTTKKTAKK